MPSHQLVVVQTSSVGQIIKTKLVKNAGFQMFECALVRRSNLVELKRLPKTFSFTQNHTNIVRANTLGIAPDIFGVPLFSSACVITTTVVE